MTNSSTIDDSANPLPTASPDREVTLPSSANQSTDFLDNTLNEIRSGRRLDKIVSSIESFLQSQVTRLDRALEECRRAADNDRIVQKLLADAQLERENWERKRQAEILRLEQAGERLAQGWKQLEDERRNWLDQQDGVSHTPGSEHSK